MAEPKNIDQTSEEKKKSIAKNLSKAFYSIVKSGATLLLEALIIWQLWNYVFASMPLNYWKSLGLLLLVRLFLRNVITINTPTKN